MAEVLSAVTWLVTWSHPVWIFQPETIALQTQKHEEKLARSGLDFVLAFSWMLPLKIKNAFCLMDRRGNVSSKFKPLFQGGLLPCFIFQRPVLRRLLSANQEASWGQGWAHDPLSARSTFTPPNVLSGYSLTGGMTIFSFHINSAVNQNTDSVMDWIVSPHKFTCWGADAQWLRMWPYLEMGL